MKIKMLIPTILALAISVGAQPASEKITPKEYREANDVARRFWSRLLDTKDFKPLLREFFVENIIERHRKNKEGYSRDFLSPDEMKFVNSDEQKQLFTAGNTWVFLGYWYINSVAPPKCVDGDDLLKCFPKDVQKILYEDPVLAKSLMEDSGSPVSYEPTTRESTSEYVSKALQIFNKTNVILRKHAIRKNAGRDRRWRTLMKEASKYVDYYQPSVTTPETPDYGYPKGTRFISVNTPIFQLELIRSRGRLKIIDLQIYSQ